MTNTNTTNTNKTTNTLTAIITANASNNKPLAAKDTEKVCVTYRKDVEAVRLAISKYAVLAIDNASADKLTAAENNFFTQYKTLLSRLQVNGNKLHATATDLQSILAFCGNYRKDKELNKREFLPVSAATFRNNFEKFVAHRINSEKSKTAEEIEEARKERNKAKAEARKLAKKAEKAKSNKVA